MSGLTVLIQSPVMAVWVIIKMIIKDFSAHIMPGQKVAIVGPTGAGKTAIVNCLVRFFRSFWQSPKICDRI